MRAISGGAASEAKAETCVEVLASVPTSETITDEPGGAGAKPRPSTGTSREPPPTSGVPSARVSSRRWGTPEVSGEFSGNHPTTSTVASATPVTLNRLTAPPPPSLVTIVVVTGSVGENDSDDDGGRGAPCGHTVMNVLPNSEVPVTLRTTVPAPTSGTPPRPAIGTPTDWPGPSGPAGGAKPWSTTRAGSRES